MLANQLSRCGYSVPTLREMKPPLSLIPTEATSCDILIWDFRLKWCSDSVVVSECRAREFKLGAGDRWQGDNTDLDGTDAMGLEWRVMEIWAAIRDYTSDNWTGIKHGGPPGNDRSMNSMRENQRRGYRNRKQKRVDLTPTKGGEPPSASREPLDKQYHQVPMPMYMTSGLGSMDISWLHNEAISAATKPRNQMPLPFSPSASIFLGSDGTTFLHKYQSIAAFTGNDPSSRKFVVMLPYYCTEAIWETVKMMHGYERRDWAALKKEMLDAFRYTDSRPNSLVSTRQYLENRRAEFGGRDDTECVMSFLRTYDHICRVVTERGTMVEYEKTEMLLHALPKRLWRRAIAKLGLNILEPRPVK